MFSFCFFINVLEFSITLEPDDFIYSLYVLTIFM